MKRRFNGIVPAAVGAQDVLDRTANGTFAAALGTLVVGAGLYFGRGIRREKDTAVFSILDSRTSLCGRYRAEILNTLPTMPVTDRLMDVEDFIIRKKTDSYFMDKENAIA